MKQQEHIKILKQEDKLHFKNGLILTTLLLVFLFCSGCETAKGIGEGVVAPVPAAIAQAIYNAIGIRFDKLPITPERVFKALKSRAVP